MHSSSGTTKRPQLASWFSLHTEHTYHSLCHVLITSSSHRHHVPFLLYLLIWQLTLHIRTTLLYRHLAWEDSSSGSALAPGMPAAQTETLLVQCCLILWNVQVDTKKIDVLFLFGEIIVDFYQVILFRDIARSKPKR